MRIDAFSKFCSNAVIGQATRNSTSILDLVAKSSRSTLLALGCLLCGLLLLGSNDPAAAATERVSVASDGTQANGNATSVSVSSNGRYVAFGSEASNLVSTDTSDAIDVFVRDRQLDITERVSIASDGSQADQPVWGSDDPSISADGRYVAFTSAASNFVPDDSTARDIFVHDRVTGTTRRVSSASDGTEADGASFDPSISADGRYVVFVSTATDIAPADLGFTDDVFVHDVQTGLTEHVARPPTPGHYANGIRDPAISADGRYVTFLFRDDTPYDNTSPDVFVFDRQTGEYDRVSGTPGGFEDDNVWVSDPVISANGRIVAFSSEDSQLVPGDTNDIEDIFVHDRALGTTERVSVASGGGQASGISGSYAPSLSADGRFVQFSSFASNLVPGDTNDSSDVFVHDRQNNATVRASVASNGTQANDSVGGGVLSANGQFTVFFSRASNLVANDSNGMMDVFIRQNEGISPPSDRDGDGIPDSDDQCPDVPAQTVTGCPAEPPSPDTYVALGDSYSSGHGVGDYEPGTHKDGDVYPANDCQRSTGAYGQIVAKTLELPLVFKACSGATTYDLLFPRDDRESDPWGESAQFDYLDSSTKLVTLSIGGNDADFKEVLEECILGFELLPWNTCSGDEKVTVPVREALGRLSGDLPTEKTADIIPYKELFKEARRRAPFATRVAVGYPEFFVEDGAGEPVIGERCRGVKLVDQRWLIRQVRRINDLAREAARRYGFDFVSPSADGRFRTHEFCGGGIEWFFPPRNPSPPPFKHPGAFHPTADGQAAIAQAVLDKLDNPDGHGEKFIVASNETTSRQFHVSEGKDRFVVSSEWPGSDVVMSLTSPGGEEHTRSDPGPGVEHEYGSTWEQFEISNPEPGEWLVELYGADVPAEGEPVILSTFAEDPPNAPPTAHIAQRREGDRLILDASGSTDTDGQIGDYDWYVSSAEAESTATGQTLSLPAEQLEGRTVTLIVTDDEGATDFAAVELAATTVPESAVPSVTGASVFAQPTVALDRSQPWLRAIRLQVRTRRGWRTSHVIRASKRFRGQIKRIKRRVRLVFWLSERARVTLRMRAIGKRTSWQRRRVWQLHSGRHKLLITNLVQRVRRGRYLLTLVARDQVGNLRTYKYKVVLVR